jgi:hypothetical protein
VVFLERYANVLSVGMFPWVFVVSYVSALRRKDAVIAAKFTVLARKPRSAALAEYNVAGDYIFAWSDLLAMLRISCGMWHVACMYLHSSWLLIAFPGRPWRRWLVLETDAMRNERMGV